MTPQGKDNLGAGEARGRFSEILGRAAYGKERVLIHRHGKPFAAVVPLEDVALLEALGDGRDTRDPRAARSAAKREWTTPWAGLKRMVGL